MNTDDIKTRLGGLIEAGWISYPGGDFFLEIPTAEWDALEAELNRSKMARKFMARTLIWRGEYVTRGSKWMVYQG